MSIPMTPAQAAQNQNRTENGQYKTKTHSEAEVSLDSPSGASIQDYTSERDRQEARLIGLAAAAVQRRHPDATGYIAESGNSGFAAAVVFEYPDEGTQTIWLGEDGDDRDEELSNVLFASTPAGRVYEGLASDIMLDGEGTYEMIPLADTQRLQEDAAEAEHQRWGSVLSEGVPSQHLYAFEMDPDIGPVLRDEHGEAPEVSLSISAHETVLTPQEPKPYKVELEGTLTAAACGPLTVATDGEADQVRARLNVYATGAYAAGMDRDADLYGPILARQLGTPVAREPLVVGEDDADVDGVVADAAELGIEGEPVFAAYSYQHVHPLSEDEDAEPTMYRRCAVIAREQAGAGRVHTWLERNGVPQVDTVDSQPLDDTDADGDGYPWQGIATSRVASAHRGGVLEGIPDAESLSVVYRNTTGVPVIARGGWADAEHELERDS